MAGKFKVGDIVRLKSGGPEMTVKMERHNSITHEHDGYDCQWFGGKKLEVGRFPEDSLEATTVKAPIAPGGAGA
jgi:uncharacterized protein YodC (DUF2158 family)